MNTSGHTNIQFMSHPQGASTLGQTSQVKYLVSSHVNYKTSRDMALKSMSYIPPEDITVVVAGEKNTDSFQEHGVTHHNTPHNAYELTGLIHTALNPHLYSGYKFILLLHDTIQLSQNSKSLVDNHPHFDFDISFLVNPPRTNMALYKVDFLTGHKHIIQQYDGISKHDALLFEENNHPLNLTNFTHKITHFPNPIFARHNYTKKYSQDDRMETTIHSIDMKKWYKKSKTPNSPFHHRP
jgi:hypothetical protein